MMNREAQTQASHKTFGKALFAISDEIEHKCAQILQPGNNRVKVNAEPPGSIMNFPLVDMEPAYTKKMRFLNNINPKQWQYEFKDWIEMSLKPSIELYEDYVLVASTQWQQIFSEFGGSPIISLFVIDSAVCKDIIKIPPMPDTDFETGEKYELSQLFEHIPDIKPIRGELFVLEGADRQIDQKGILVSRFIGPKLFLSHFSQFFSFPPTKCKLFKAEYISIESRIVHAEEISTKGTCTKRLFDYEVSSNTKFFVTQCYEGDTKFYSEVKEGIRRWMIAKEITLIEDREQPKSLTDIYVKGQGLADSYVDSNYFAGGTGGSVPQKSIVEQRRGAVSFTDQVHGGNNFQIPYVAPAAEVPEEYRDDPELYYAIQESLGLGNKQSNAFDADLNGWDNNGGRDELMQSHTPYIPLKQKRSPSSGDDISNKNNESMDDQSDKMFEDYDEGSFPNYNQSPSKLKKGDKNHAKVIPIIQVSNLDNGAKVEKKSQTKQDRMKEVREQTKDKFELMRQKARNAVRREPYLQQSSVFTVAQMGRIKGFGELQDSIMKMRENFDFLVLGKVPPPVQTRLSPCGMLEGEGLLEQEPCLLGTNPFEDDSCC